MRNTVYISGPMTGLPDYNYPAFFAAERRLQEMGYTVENPAKNPDPDPKTWENFMRLALPQVCKCGIVAVLPGWETSRGAQLEVEVARHLGGKVLPIESLYDLHKQGEPHDTSAG